MANECRICGWEGMAQQHRGAVDCLNQYRAYVDELQRLLPEGRQVLLATIARDSNARVWIDGEITYEGLERLITFIRFMQEAWTEVPETVKPESDVIHKSDATATSGS